MDKFARTANGDSVTDPSDWLSSSVPELQQLDSALRCHICKDIFVAPMVTACCANTFCSLCIRRQFTRNGKCPTCNKPGVESQLKKNRELEMASEAFVTVRQVLLDKLKKKKGKKAKAGKSMSLESVEEKIETENDEEIVEITSVSQSDSNQVLDPSLGNCPICNKVFPVNIIQTVHLDKCIQSGGEPTSPLPLTTATTSETATATATNTATKTITSTSPPQQPSFRSMTLRSATKQNATPFLPQKLPKPGTSKNTLKEVRSRLRKLGVPSNGTLSELVRREAEWINLWNANCDARQPRRRAELLHDLQMAPLSDPHGTKRKYTAEDARSYSQKENDTFRQLAKRAKASLKKKVLLQNKNNETINEEELNHTESNETIDSKETS